MPELPEVERLRQSLLPHLLAARVINVLVHRADVCECFESLGNADEKIGQMQLQSVAPSPECLLAGCRIKALYRHGKHLAIETQEGPSLCVHLGMSGQVLVQEPTEIDREQALRTHTHVVWMLDQANITHGVGDQIHKIMLFRDPRRFGGLWSYPSLELLRASRWSHLGPDALLVQGEELSRAIAGSKRAIKAALLDQSVLAGVGNIYADESLFRAGISPRRLALRLRPDACKRLAAMIRDVLRESIAAGGSSMRDYLDANGKAGTSQVTHRVYGRGGAPCLSCGTLLRSALIAQRTTVWCPKCQA